MEAIPWNLPRVVANFDNFQNNLTLLQTERKMNIRYLKKKVWKYFELTLVDFNAIKVNDRNSRKRCEICLDLTIKTPERRH